MRLDILLLIGFGVSEILSVFVTNIKSMQKILLKIFCITYGIIIMIHVPDSSPIFMGTPSIFKIIFFVLVLVNFFDLLFLGTVIKKKE